MSWEKSKKIQKRIQDYGDRFGRPREMDIPKDKSYPEQGVGQCDECGGHGCIVCHDTGWLSDNHRKVRRCHRHDCDNVIPPHQVAVYCTARCAVADA